MPSKSKLTPEEIEEIKASDKSLKELAFEYGISITYVHYIRSGGRSPNRV